MSTYWTPIPDQALPGQYRSGDYLRDSHGAVVKIIGRSTQMLLMRRATWYERLWLAIRGGSVRETPLE